MKLRFTLIVSFSILLSFNLMAHEGGHGQTTKTWMIDGELKVAEFVKYENKSVYLLNINHEVNVYELSQFSEEDREWILNTYQKVSNLNHFKSAPSSKAYNIEENWLGYLLGTFVVFLSLLLYSMKRKRIHFLYGTLGISLIAFTACSKNDFAISDPKEVPANDVNFMTSIFEKFAGVSTDADNKWFYISSNGLPEHNMMVGITNWQQQVPIDQHYTGSNRWAVPIQPELSENPLSTKTNLLKGAIAIAVNGIPIFNPLNNRGEDANAIGELDQWGGHCGRADDYHYHLPPVHLQSQVGEGNPLAYAVDGFPVYGETTDTLDEYLGKFNDNGSYQYHTIGKYPYFIAGMRGMVSLDPNTTAPENQVLPQAITHELRPATGPLRGAVITGFESHGDSSYSLTYTLNGESYSIHYSWDANGLYAYEFVSPNGTIRVETYQR